MRNEAFVTAARIGPGAWDSMRGLPRRSDSDVPVAVTRTVEQPIQRVESTTSTQGMAKPEQRVWGGKTGKDPRFDTSQPPEDSGRSDIEVTLALLDGIQTDSDGKVFQADSIKKDYAIGTRDLLTGNITIQAKEK
jgi:hypothetical protein